MPVPQSFGDRARPAPSISSTWIDSQLRATRAV
jgi:hypothetical protein